jgi:hypothetical protein
LAFLLAGRRIHPLNVHPGSIECPVKIGANIVTHVRYTVFQIAEVAVLPKLFRRTLEMIEDLRPRQMARC